MRLTPSDILPADAHGATLLGRLWVSGPLPGPRPVQLRGNAMVDLSPLAATASELFDLEDLAARLATFEGETLCTLEHALDEGRLLAPCDLQSVKAAGVTFADSVIERMMEERSRGNPQSAGALRDRLLTVLAGPVTDIEPGSAAAARVREVLEAEGLWSQYLEVALGPDAEIFTKAQPLSAVGCGAHIGVHPASRWSCSEPEVVVAVDRRGNIIGATLGNDLTLRDFEGRSALLLGRAKDNNASCAIGPFVRLFADDFDLDRICRAEVDLTVEGADGFRASGTNRLDRISRHPSTLVAQTSGASHQYPDGLMLFLGTMYVPNADRDGPGRGFTHHPGDRVRVACRELGALVNEVTTSDRAPPWTFGARALFRSLAARGLA